MEESKKRYRKSAAEKHYTAYCKAVRSGQPGEELFQRFEKSHARFQKKAEKGCCGDSKK